MRSSIISSLISCLLPWHHQHLLQPGGLVYQQAKSIPLKSAAILVFCLGALAIGLVLLDHQHCNAGGGDGHDHGGGDAHAGHNHGRMLSQLFDTKQIGLVR